MRPMQRTFLSIALRRAARGTGSHTTFYSKGLQ